MKSTMLSLVLSFCSLVSLAASPQNKIDSSHYNAVSNKQPAQTKINAKSFGFLPTSSASKNTAALQKISAKINSSGGGITLVIDKGIYNVGNEVTPTALAKGYAFRGETMLQISNCKSPVIIEGNGAVIKLRDGLHFGSFNKQTGAVHRAPGGGFYNNDYSAYPQILMEIANNKSVTIRNLTLDGNLQNFTLGGYWGDTGIQLPGDGIFGRDNESLSIENVTCRYFPRDGIMISNAIPDEKAAIKKIFLRNSLFDGNGRQGFSWIGGNHLVASNCRFINTGKTINRQSGSAFLSAPGAGVDMEAEVGLIRNGLFENCLIDNNAGAGFLTVGDVASITVQAGKIVGATSWSIYGSGPNAVFNKAIIVGSPVNLRMGINREDQKNTQFNHCLISLDSTLSSTGRVYGNYVMDFGGGAHGLFTNCTIDSKGRGTVYGGDCVFTNCIFKQSPTDVGYNGYPFLVGTFYGTNKWYRPGAGVMPANLDKSRFYGPFYVNDVLVADKK